MTAYDDLRRARGPKLASDVAREREREKSRRRAEARRRTAVVMEARYPDEWAVLMAENAAAVDEERGALPGEEGA